MKKFTSLFFALAVMLSVNAALPKEVAKKLAKENRIEFASPVKSHVVRTKAGRANFVLPIAGNELTIRKVKAAALVEVDVNFDEPFSYKYSTYYGDWEISAENADYTVALDIINNDELSLEGSYTEADLYGSNGPSAYFNNVTDKASGTRHGVSTATIDVTVDGARTDIDAHLVCSDGAEFHVTMYYATPEAEVFEEISANMFMTDEVEEYGYYTFATTTIRGANDDYSFTFTYDDAISTLVDGDTLYIGKNLDGSITAVGESESKAYSGYLVVTAIDGDYRLRGTVLCYNNVEYTLDLIYVLPEATRSATLTASVTLNDLISSMGAFQLYGYNADKSKFASVTIYSSQLSGTYALADLYKTYTFVDELGADTVELSPISANLTVAAAANGDVTLTGTMRMINVEDFSDVVDYTLNLTYTKPVATRTLALTGAGNFIDYSSQSGDWYVYGASADGKMLFGLDFYYQTAGVVAGTYSASDVYKYYTSVGLVNGTDTVYYDFVDGSFTVAVDANNNGTITGTMTGQNADNLSDVVEFTVNVTFTVAGGTSGQDDAFDYDDDSEFSKGFAEYDINTQYVAQYGVILVSAEDDEAGVILQFTVETTATGLDAGTYPINSTNAAGTLHASTGYDATYGPDYSFAYTYSGEYYQHLWYMVSGSAVVTNNSIVVSALNSLGHNINITLGAGAAVDNIDANASVVKTIRNGQVVIRRADKEYNALGVEMK